MSKMDSIVVIGGGAAGFFGAITAAQAHPNLKIILLEKAKQVLAKVRISGGGRCNVTHACFDPALLTQYYPRGHKVLRGPFSRFQPKDTIEWFTSRGVELKTESDGRMFPISDSSETIISCLRTHAKFYNVDLRTECGVQAINKEDDQFCVQTSNEDLLYCSSLLIATGSNNKMFDWLKQLGHTIESPVPSLFTFNIPNFFLEDIAGISVPKVHLKILDTQLEQTGPLLITHWGFSGPAVLKLSAWGARVLFDMNYLAKLSINWLPEHNLEILREKLLTHKNKFPNRLVLSDFPFDLPKNLWRKLCEKISFSTELRWTAFSNKNLHDLLNELTKSCFQISGKSTYKEEFVTCGGVNLNEVNFKTMESKICPGLYFAGEVLDIDGVTGGFNFQNAWTTAWIAGQSMQ